MAKRRANGEGSLRQRSDGRWEHSFMIGRKDNGKPRIISFYGKTQKEVKAKSKAYMEASDAGLIMEKDYCFDEWADFWYENHRKNITITTQESYKYTLRYLKKHFGSMKISKIKPFHVEIMLNSLQQKGHSHSLLSKTRAMLYQIMNKAEANDLIRKNPVRYAEKLRYREVPHRKPVFTANEISTLMEKLPDDRIGFSIRLMLGTGIRTQELLALEPRHIEADGSVIHIEQAVNMQKGTAVIGLPKSKDSFRSVPVPPNLIYCALALRNTDKTFIWEERKAGQPCNPSFFRNQFRKALESIPGIPVLTPHSCRHTYVSQLQALGVDLATIQSIVGHADIDMTKHYLHVQDSIRLDAVSRFSQAFPIKEASQSTSPKADKIIPFPKSVAT